MSDPMDDQIDGREDSGGGGGSEDRENRGGPVRDPKEMPFLAHLDELRGVLIKCLIALVAASAICWVFSGYILDALVVATAGEAKFIGPAEAFAARLKVTVMCGVLVSLPPVAYWIWGFVVPGLMENERRFLFPIVISSSALFYIGAAFSYFALTPVVVKVLLSFGTQYIQPQITIAPLLGLIIRLAIACGLVFQLPLVLTILSYFGVISPEWLKSKWRYAVLGIFVLAAIATPADAASQMILALPMVALYFISVVLSGVVVRAKRRRASEDEDEP
jgi:sec-independent protein translocase protein TatC